MVHKTQTSYYHTLDKGSSVLIWSLPFLDYTTHFHLDVRNMDLGATVVLTFRWSCNPEMECVFSPLIASSFFLDYTTHYHLDIRNMDLGATVVLTLRWPCNPETEYVVLPNYDLTLNPPMVASFPWSCTMTMHTKYKVQTIYFILSQVKD